jgi:hypothetical protein
MTHIEPARLNAGSWLTGKLELTSKVYITTAGSGSEYRGYSTSMTGVWTTRKKAEQWIAANRNNNEYVGCDLEVREYVLDEEIVMG